MATLDGLKLLTWVGRAAIKRHHQVLPGYGERRYVVRRYSTDLLAHWIKYHGLRIVARRPAMPSGLAGAWTYFEGEEHMPIRKPLFRTDSLSLPDLPSDSVVLKKFPTLIAFLTARSYEDGSARAVGKIWLEGDSGGFTITLIDVDNALRLAVRASSLDAVLTATELALGADSAPWEIDQYQAARRANKGKKK